VFLQYEHFTDIKDNMHTDNSYHQYSILAYFSTNSEHYSYHPPTHHNIDTIQTVYMSKTQKTLSTE